MSKSKLKKRFLTMFLAVAMVFTSVNLTPFGTFTAHAADPIIPADDYYIVSAITGMVLNGGNAWGTHALTSNYGQLMTFKVADAEQNTYQVDSYILNNDDANKHYLNGEWVDDASTTVIKLELADDGFYIMNADQKYMTAPAAGANSTSVTLEENTSDLAKWRILTRQQFIDAAVEQNNKIADGQKTPVDVTSLIFDAGINRKNARYNKWSMDYGVRGSSGQDKLAEKDTRDNSKSGKCVELYHHAFDFYQVLENVPNGIYELSVQGFCRQDANSKAAAEYYLNDTGKALMTPAQIESGTAANDLTSALNSFIGGKYKNEFLPVMVRDHTLRVGIKSTDAENWVSWSSFTLKLKESMDDNELAAFDLGEVIDKIGEPALTLECKRSIDAAKAFYDALTPEQKASAAVTEKYTQLQAKETVFQGLLQAEGGQATFDQACADEVIAKITAIGTVELTDASKKKIDEAREAFEALTESQQAMVTNKTALDEAEAAYKSLKDAEDKAAADAVKVKIDAIGEVTFTVDSRLAIKDAKAAFEALTDDQKTLVAEEDKAVLTKAEADYQALETGAERNLKDGDYYIVNASTGRCLNAGNSYQTQGSALTYGQLMTIVAKAGNPAFYTVDTHYNKGGKHFLGGNGYLDSAETTLRIEKCKNGNFVIVNDSDQFLTAPAKDAETTAASITAERSPESEWLILNHAQFMEKALQDVTKETPIDVTSLIFDACTDRYNDYHSKWDKAIITEGKNAPLGGKDANLCVEFYMGEGNISQTIQNVPNGQYELSVQGYYRAQEQDAVPAVYYINDVEENLKSVWSEGKEQPTGGWASKKETIDFDKTGLCIPDSQSNASDCFTAGGYVNEFITATVTDHTLKVGIKTKDAKSWVVFDKFTLRLKNGDAEFAERVVAKINDIGKVSLAPECKTKIDAAKAAYDALTDAQKALVKEEQLKVLTDAETEYNRLWEEGGQEALDRAAADAVIVKIDAIGTVEFTDASKAKIDEARAAYEGLTEAQKALVEQDGKLTVLTSAEVAYKNLGEAADRAAADGVVAKINAIGDVTFTLESRLAIRAARAAYEALTDIQKGFVTAVQLKVLTDAEDRYAELVAAGAVLDNGDYYILNASTGEYLNAGNGYQTQASVRTYGQLMTIAVTEDDNTSYTVDSHYTKGGKHHLGENGYLDAQPAPIKIEKCAGGRYTISNSSDNFLTAPVKEEESTIVSFTAERSAESEWFILTREELIQKLSDKVTKDKPADITSLIFDSGIAEYNDYYSKWSANVITPEKNVVKRGDADNRNLEVYQGEFDFYQTIEDIPNGVYQLSIQGFYRPDGDNANSAVPPVYYINGTEGNFMSIDAGASETETSGWTTKRNGAYVPDSMEDASKCFSAGGYTNAFIEATVTDHTLKVGVKAKDTISWVLWDNFTLRLKELATEGLTDDEIAARVVRIINAIGNVEATEDCKARIDEARAAYEELTPAQRALIADEDYKILTDAEAKYDELMEEQPAPDELKNELKEAIESAETEALVEEAYTETSWQTYTEALNALQTLSEKQDATKKEIEEALKTFQEASDGLEVKEEYKPSDSQNQTLATTITDAENVKAGDYKEDENWTAFQKALARAQEIKNRPNATGAQVQKAMDDLKAAIAKLTPAQEEEKVDKAALDKAVKDCAGLKAADYTTDTWNAFNTALEAAKKILGKADATQAEVNAALATLNAKKQALKKPIKVSRIKITADYTKVAAGKKAILKANITPSNTANKAVTWSIDKTAKSKKYASISSKGVLTTKSKGAGKTVTVTAAAKDGSGKKSTIKIKIMKGAVKKVSLKAKAKKVKVGKKLTVKTTVKYSSKKKSDTNVKLTWKTSNKKVATVNSKGVVTGKKAGKVTITAASTDGTKKSGKIKITVVKK